MTEGLKMSANQKPKTYDVMWQTLSGLHGDSAAMTPRDPTLYSEYPFLSASSVRCRAKPAKRGPGFLAKWFAR